MSWVVIRKPRPVAHDERADWLAHLEYLGLVSAGALPFRDDVAPLHGVRHIAEPGGFIRSSDVDLARSQHRIAHLTHGIPRLFHH